MKILIAVLVMFVFVLPSKNVNAQWEQCDGPRGGYLNVYALTIKGNSIFMGTDFDGVSLTTNNGTSWTQTSLNYKTVWSLATSGNNIVAGTLDGGVYISMDNGISWTQTTLSNYEIKSISYKF